MSLDADRDATRPFRRPSPAAVPTPAESGPGPSGEPPAREPGRGVSSAEPGPEPAGSAAVGAPGEPPPEEVPAGPATPEAPGGVAPARPRLLARLPQLPQGGRLLALAAGAAVAAGLVTALIVAEVSLAHANAVDHARSEAMAAAESFAVDISSYDYRHLDQDFNRVTDHATGKLKSDFGTASRSLAPLLVRVKGTATGTVVAAGVADATTDRVTVVVFLDQTVSNTTAPAPRLDRSRLVMTLTHGSSGWLVDSVQPR
jgi:Mce-associated membrane protein